MVTCRMVSTAADIPLSCLSTHLESSLIDLCISIIASDTTTLSEVIEAPVALLALDWFNIVSASIEGDTLDLPFFVPPLVRVED